MIKNARIGHLHHDIFLLLRPEFISFLLPYTNLFISVRLKASKTLMKDFGSRSKMMPLYKWPNLREGEGEGERGRRVGQATLTEERALIILSVASISFNRISTSIRHIRDYLCLS